MPDDRARPSGSSRTLRDVLLLVAVAVVLLVGLLHYGSRLRGQDDETHRHLAASGPRQAATDVAQPDSDRRTAPVSAPPSATCWDGRTASSLAACSLPRGTAGLKWVFPSLLAPGTSCHPAPRPAGAYRDVVGWECFARAAGHPVAITYEQVASPQSVRRVVESEYAGARRFSIPGAHGGRDTWFDATSQPVRVTGLYEQFPYVVSLYAPTSRAARTAWATLVEQRPTRAIRGLPR